MLVWTIFYLYCLMSAQGLSASYYLVKQSLTWLEALNYCRTQYTDLVSIESDTDLFQVSAVALMNEVWVGLYLCSPGLWRWSTGDALGSYTKWNPGMPSQTSDSCARLSLGKWNDGSCDLRYYFICYKESNTAAPDIPATCPWPLMPTTAAPLISSTESTMVSNKQYTNSFNGSTNGASQQAIGVGQQTDILGGQTKDLTIEKRSVSQTVELFDSSGNVTNVASTPPQAAVQTTTTVATTDSTAKSQTSQEQSGAAISGSISSITMLQSSSQESATTIGTGSTSSTTTTQVSASQNLGGVSGILHLVMTPMSWLKSRLYCRSNFTDLAAVLSLQEQNNMAALLLPYTSSGGFWIGLRYNRFRSRWYWSGRQQWGAFSYWGAGEPDDPFSKPCGKISGNLAYNFTWSSECCNQELPFICYGGS